MCSDDLSAIPLTSGARTMNELGGDLMSVMLIRQCTSRPFGDVDRDVHGPLRAERRPIEAGNGMSRPGQPLVEVAYRLEEGGSHGVHLQGHD
jgi:hypothetical protein